MLFWHLRPSNVMWTIAEDAKFESCIFQWIFPFVFHFILSNSLFYSQISRGARLKFCIAECEWYGQLYCSGDIIIDLYRSWNHKIRIKAFLKQLIYFAVGNSSKSVLTARWAYTGEPGRKWQRTRDSGWCVIICQPQDLMRM